MRKAMSKKNAALKPDDSTFYAPFRSIYCPPKQIRHDEPKLQSLAQSLKEEGQEYPVLVRRGGPDGYLFTLDEGYRRMAAWVLNGWQNRDILVKVKDDSKSKPVDRSIRNWRANMEREPIGYVDQCEYVSSLIEGSYHVLDGEVAESLSVEEVSKRLNISENQVKRMHRAWKQIDGDVMSLARKAQAPSYVLEKVVATKGEGSDEEARLQDRANKQSAIVNEWLDKQTALEQAGRKRAVRSDKGTKKNKKKADVPDGVVNPEKKVAHATYKTEKDRSYSVQDYVRVLSKKQDALVRDRGNKPVRELTNQQQAIRIAGILDGIRFMTGEIKKLPDLTKTDFDVLRPAETSDAAAE